MDAQLSRLALEPVGRLLQPPLRPAREFLVPHFDQLLRGSSGAYAYLRGPGGRLLGGPLGEQSPGLPDDLLLRPAQEVRELVVLGAPGGPRRRPAAFGPDQKVVQRRCFDSSPSTQASPIQLVASGTSKAR